MVMNDEVIGHRWEVICVDSMLHLEGASRAWGEVVASRRRCQNQVIGVVRQQILDCILHEIWSIAGAGVLDPEVISD